MENNILNKNSEKRKSSLGRGLGSLLGESSSIQSRESVPQMGSNAAEKSVSTTSTKESEKIHQIPTYKLVPGPYQPRNHFDAEKLQELSVSIKNHGVIQPIVAQKISDNKYEIVAGERRWRASQLAELQVVPVILIENDASTTLEMALIENVQREDLNPIEQALAYRRLSEDFGYTQVQIAEKVGKERATITNLLRILSLPNYVIQHIEQGKVTLGHAKVLLTVTDEKVLKNLTHKIVQKNMSVRALESEINLSKTDTRAKTDTKGETAFSKTKTLQETLQKKLGTSTHIEYKAGKGQISIKFYSDEQLNELYEKLIG